MHYTTPGSRVKYLVGVTKVQPDDPGPMFYLGNGSNDPSQRKPVLIPTDLMKNCICLVEKEWLDDDTAFKTGEKFTKADCDTDAKLRDTIRPFLVKDDTEYVLVKIRAGYPILNSTTPVQGPINESTLADMSNIHPDASQWAEMMDDFNPELHKVVVTHKKDFGAYFPDKETGQYFLKNDTLNKFIPLVVEDELHEKLEADVELLYTKLDVILDASAARKEPPISIADTMPQDRIPRTV